MKKLIITFLIMTTIFLSGCSQNETNITDDLDGKYYYVECIYLPPFSSSTLDFYPNLHGSLIYIEFFDDKIVYYGNDDETRSYNQIEYIEEDVDENFGSVITLDFDGVFETFEFRYDIYSDDISVGLSIFVNGGTMYLAKTGMIGGSHDVFTVFSIVEIKK